SLRYFHTAMTDPGPGMPWFVSVGYVNGENFVRYDSTVQRMEPRTGWMKAAVDAEYWDRETQVLQGQEQTDRVNLVTL
ncbi:HA1F protein, partial [Odontophorus gujanensis]|nr:HA1F protein [Odontophorus gujanensis]